MAGMTASTADQDEQAARRRIGLLSRLLQRPELGALGGTVIVFVVFAIVAGNTGLFSVRGIVNFLQVRPSSASLRPPSRC